MDDTDTPTDEAAASIAVLLVDDDETWVQSTAQILEQQRAAFSVRTATDVDAAARAFRQDDPDCVVCDYRLESGTGLELLDTVRAVDDRPFILVTGQGDESVASDAINRSVTEYLPKRSLGGRDDRLARRVEAAVRSHRTERALERQRASKEAMLDIITTTASPDGLERAFCSHLVDEQGYACAWVGSVRADDTVAVHAAAGAEGYVDRVLDTGHPRTDWREPALATLDSGDPTTVAPVERASDERWRTVAADYGFGCAVAVPVGTDDHLAGALAVYDDRTSLDRRERALLTEYGESIDYALRSAEWRASLLSAGDVTVEITCGDATVPLVALGQALPGDPRIEVLSNVPRADSLLYLVRVDGPSAEAVRRVDDVEPVESLSVSESDATLRCEVVTERPTPASILADHGGQVTDVRFDRGRVAVAVRIGGQDAVTPLVDTVESVFSDTSVRSVRSSPADDEASDSHRSDQSLTAKQRQAVELAYYGGYFRRPREHNATEIAEKMGVSRQTFAQHLRAAERKLLGDLLE